MLNFKSSLEATSNRTSSDHSLWKVHQENRHPRGIQGMDHLVEVSGLLTRQFVTSAVFAMAL
jgi:hypothetical protein